MIRKSLVSLALGLALLALSLPGQTGQTGTIRGRIMDNKGAPLRGAYLYVLEGGPVNVNEEVISPLGAAMIRNQMQTEVLEIEVLSKGDAELLWVEIKL